MKKKDWILLGSLLVIIVVGLVAYRFFSPSVEKKGEVIVKVAGKEVGRYNLYQDAKIEIPAQYGTSVLEIKDGNAEMITAGCPDQICVHQGKIHFHGEMIICIPNEMIVEIKGEDQNKLDSTAK